MVRCSPTLKPLAEEVGTRFDIADMGGYRASAVDSGGHLAGLAVDLMTGQDRVLGDRVVVYLTEHAERLSVDHIIWRQANWHAADAQPGWTPMPDRGSATANHDDHHHVHLRPAPSASTGVVDCLTASAAMPAGLAAGGQWATPLDSPSPVPMGPAGGSSTVVPTSAPRAAHRSTRPPAASSSTPALDPTRGWV